MVFVNLIDVIAVTLIFLLFVTGMIYWIIQTINQTWCKHLSYRETMSCDAICNKCGKNLGFIMYQRKKNPQGEKFGR